MAAITFAKAVQRHVDCPPADIAGTNVREVLDGYFAINPGARTYVLDERGATRKHIAIFINDTIATDRIELSDPVAAGDRIAVFQALSGGA